MLNRLEWIETGSCTDKTYTDFTFDVFEGQTG